MQSQKRRTVRTPDQRLMHLSLPIAAVTLLDKYSMTNGVTMTTATIVAMDRFNRMPNRPEPAALGTCTAIRTDKQPCPNLRMPSYTTCNAHGVEMAGVAVTFPMELQTRIDGWAAQYGISANLVVAQAIMEVFGE